MFGILLTSSLPSFFSDEGVPRVIRRSPSANVTIASFAPSPPCCYKAALPDDPPPGHWRAVNATADGGTAEGGGGSQKFNCVEPDSLIIKGQREWMGRDGNPETQSPTSLQPAGSGLATSSSSLPLSTPADPGMPHAADRT